MNFRTKLQYSQYWNIGFCDCSATDILASKQLPAVQWMNHPYKDRWYADPFILEVRNDEIIVFVEECSINNSKGIICELVLDRSSCRLKQRFVLLELDTHLSYPAIYRENGKVYVCPENSAAGKLNIYEYDKENHRLVNPVCILDEPVADATILHFDDECYYLIATKVPDTQERAYLYKSDNLFGPYRQTLSEPVQLSRSCSRPGGAWIKVAGKLYRSSQNCIQNYGASLNIMEVDFNGIKFNEKILFSLKPVSRRYNIGLHTLNFNDGICVIDSCGYFSPIWGRIYYSKSVRLLINLIKRLK